ncbi:hypothetical protein HHK36_016154 [Tetracentron sinense]|uniref:CCHC-type domain-containing protein n=1 Tax=Tetracentron sinense TaxID=13715 RepID=A0A834YWN7_TETSI|nr:hypothetical protein HHK36_016154 [Tetracentron sinense]
MLSEIIYRELTSTKKLNGSASASTFSIWKSKIGFVFFDSRVSYVLTDPKPADDAPKLNRELCDKWVSDDYTCRHIMLFAMEDDLYLVKYSQYKMSEETHITKHILEMEVMARELEMAGMVVSDDMRSVCLMNSLAESWEPVSDRIMNMKDVELTVDIVISQLRIEGEYRESISRGHDERDASMKKHKKGFKGCCYACGKHGHCQSDCPDNR